MELSGFMFCDYCKKELNFSSKDSFYRCNNHNIDVMFFYLKFGDMKDHQLCHRYFAKTINGKKYTLLSSPGEETSSLLTLEHENPLRFFKKLMDLEYDPNLTPMEAEFLIDKLVNLLIFL